MSWCAPSTRTFKYNIFARLQWRKAQRNPCLKRWQTTAKTSPSASIPNRERPNIRFYSYAASFALVGAGLGYMVRASLLPPEAPPAGSSEDQRLISLLTHDIDALPIVRTMRKNAQKIGTDEAMENMHNDMATAQTRFKGLLPHLEQDGGDAVGDGGAGWIELPAKPPETGNLTALMTGFGGIGVQRAFWNPVSRELVMVVWFGSGLCGWPGLAHGGAIATVLVEGTRRAAECISGRCFQRTQTGGDHPHDPAVLSLTYKRPTEINNFYVLRARLNSPHMKSPIQPHVSSDKDLTKTFEVQEQANALLVAKPVEIDGGLETIDGRVCVKVKTSWNI